MDIDIERDEGIDTWPIINLVLDATEQIKEGFGIDATIRTVALVLDVDSPDAEQILVVCSDGRWWVKERFLDEALTTLENARDLAQLIDMGEAGDESGD